MDQLKINPKTKIVLLHLSQNNIYDYRVEKSNTETLSSEMEP